MQQSVRAFRERAERPRHRMPVMERHEVRRLLEAKIDGLPEALRIVFVLRALEEFSVEETAAALGIPAATVGTCYLKARDLLAESLADRTLEEAFTFDGGRCDRIVAKVLERIASGT